MEQIKTQNPKDKPIT